MTSKEKTRKKTILITTHILIWTVLLGLPYLLAAGESFNALRVLRRSTIPLIFYAIIFYTNYFVLIDKLWLKKDKVYFVLVNALLIAAFITLNHKLRPLLIDATSSPDLPKPFNLLVYIEVMSMLLPIAFSIALKAYEKWVQSEEANKQARSEKIESELQHLKYQL
ncbi:MAG TPA: hypothetical protein VL947_05070, partial [Cytophagales bacterium]|nr:hypothetical protein [Cytophagales bacterium]